MHVTLSLVAAVLLDRLLGEPEHMHPLAGFGRLASTAEAHLNEAGYTPSRRRLHGVLALVVLISPFAFLCVLAVLTPVVGRPLEIAVLYLTLGGQSLTAHARNVAAALRGNDLETARLRVSFMVSRDTGAMQGDDVARATVESVLENGNDAVFGALFWFIVAGAPGAVVYRLSNTLDAMWGYRNARYLHFGWAAARLDDLLNFIPARLTAFTYTVLGHPARAWRCWRNQGGVWESPNAGPVMAAGAGALGVKLGGPAYYHGAWKERPALGEGLPAVGNDIERAVLLVQRSVVLWLGVAIIIAVGGSLLA
jgi:adenosylcobinamide-phosphate synthase